MINQHIYSSLYPSHHCEPTCFCVFHCTVAPLAPPTGSCLHREAKLLTLLLMTAGGVLPTHSFQRRCEGAERIWGREADGWCHSLGVALRWAFSSYTEFSLSDYSWEIHSRMEIIWAETTLDKKVRAWNLILAKWEEKQVCHTCSPNFWFSLSCL